MMLARCGGMFTATSTSPYCSAATRTASSGMGRKTTLLILGAPRQYWSLASRTICSSLSHFTNLYGPVPIGVFEMNAVSFPAYALGGYMDAWRNPMMVVKVGQGLVVCTRTVYGSTMSTLSMGRKFELERIPDFTRSRLNFTDSALNSSPLWNLIPLRSLTSQVVGATSLGSSAARAGTSLRFGSRSTSVSKMCVATTDAGVSCWFMVSSVVGSTPCAITTLPSGAASAGAGSADMR